jgi:hypothetical protein
MIMNYNERERWRDSSSRRPLTSIITDALKSGHIVVDSGTHECIVFEMEERCAPITSKDTIGTRCTLGLNL